ncbi:GPP34 family phosphoprotein [Nocardia heshunensis]
MESITDDLVWLLLDDANGEAVLDRRAMRFVVEAALDIDAIAEAGPGRSGLRPSRGETVASAVGRLAEQSRVCAMPIRRWGVFPARCFPTLDRAGKTALRAALLGALRGEQPSDRRTSGLIALLASVDALATQFPDLAPTEIERLTTAFLACRADCQQLARQVCAAICHDYARSFCGAM